MTLLRILEHVSGGIYMTLQYKKMSLFLAPPGSILAHGCNAQGVMERGIAAQFKHFFPNNFLDYHNVCKAALFDNPQFGALGTCISHEEDGYKLFNLVTSFHFDPHDPLEKMLISTSIAINNCNKYLTQKDKIYSNKFNSGLFGLP